MILQLIEEAKGAGARQKAACRVLGLDPSTIERWRSRENKEDLRRGPKTKPQKALSEAERAKAVEILNSAKYRDMSPHQIVPHLTDQGEYVCSESTMYRLLRERGQAKHREPSRPPTKSHRPSEYVATGPNQVWSWDITYLRAPVRGTFYYLYMFLDIWSRKIVGWEVHEEERSELAAWLMKTICDSESIEHGTLVLHADNGAAMKAGTTLATLQKLGVAASFSRPSVSNDNPFSEACFRTVKYRPGFPKKPFEGLHAARQWVAGFVEWYNTEHLHSAIRFLTPEDRHEGKGPEILKARGRTYNEARARNPERWTKGTRDWSDVHEVTLNRAPDQEVIVTN